MAFGKTKFETIGVNMQYTSPDKNTALKRYARSCECCCVRGMQLKCERCAIEVAHQMVMASFESEVR